MKTTLICFSKETLESTLAALQGHMANVSEEFKQLEFDQKMDRWEKHEKLSQLRVEKLRVSLLIDRLSEKLEEV